jgi:hypothetical protein
MIAPNLYADLAARGVKLSIAKTPKRDESLELPPARLRIRAPEGALTDSLRAAIAEHKGELLQFVFELEESAAILQVMQGNRIEESERLARECVRGGTATADGQLWLREYAQRELDRLGVTHVFGGLEIISVERECSEAQEALNRAS